MSNMKWKLVKRKKVFNSKFVKVYQDIVKLPNGKIINDYTLVEKPSYVEIVATDAKKRIITIKEYRHGTGKVMLQLPAGFTEINESPIDAAKRELREETGFTGGKFKYVGILYGYASKDTHKIYVVRVTGLKSRGAQELEDSEMIDVNLISIPTLKMQILKKKWQDTGAIAALAMCGLLF